MGLRRSWTSDQELLCTGYDPNPWTYSIVDLDVGVRAYNCLVRAGIGSAGEVAARSREDLLGLGLGDERAVEEVERGLAALGLALRADPEGDFRKCTAFVRPNYRTPVRTAAFHPGGRLLASAGWEEGTRLWDGRTGRPMGAAPEEEDDGSGYLWNSEAGCTARLWDVAGGEPAGPPLTGHTDTVWEAAFHPEGRLLATAGSDDSARLWDTATGRQVGDPLSGHIRSVYTLAFHPDGELLATAGWDTGVRLWEVSTRRLIALLADDAEDVRGGIWSLAFHPGGEFFATGGEDGLVRLQDLYGEVIAVLEGHAAMVHKVAFHPDGRLLATGGEDGTARLWDAATGDPFGAPLEHAGGVEAVAFHPGGRLLATAGRDCAVRLWDIATGRLEALFVGHNRSVNAIAFHPDGETLATAGQDGAVVVWGLPRS